MTQEAITREAPYRTKKERILEILFYDPSQDGDGWEKIKDTITKEPSKVKAIGYFVYEDKKFITLAQMSWNEHSNGRITIIKSTIISRYELKV